MITTIILTPVYALLTAVHICLAVIVRLSAWIFYIVGGLFIITTAFCYFMDLESGAELRRMMIVSASVFLLPHAATVIDCFIAAAAEAVGMRIHER